MPKDAVSRTTFLPTQADILKRGTQSRSSVSSWNNSPSQHGTFTPIHTSRSGCRDVTGVNHTWRYKCQGTFPPDVGLIELTKKNQPSRFDFFHACELRWAFIGVCRSKASIWRHVCGLDPSALQPVTKRHPQYQTSGTAHVLHRFDPIIHFWNDPL